MIFNLLIVDDEAPIRKGLSEYIKNHKKTSFLK